MDKRKVDVIDIWLAISGGDIHLTSAIRSLMNAIVARARILKNIQKYMACNIRRQYPLDLRHPVSYMNVIVDKARIFNNILPQLRGDDRTIAINPRTTKINAHTTGFFLTQSSDEVKRCKYYNILFQKC